MEYILQIPLHTDNKEFAEQMKEDIKDVLNQHGRDRDDIILVRFYSNALIPREKT